MLQFLPHVLGVSKNIISKQAQKLLSEKELEIINSISTYSIPKHFTHGYKSNIINSNYAHPIPPNTVNASQPGP